MLSSVSCDKMSLICVWFLAEWRAGIITVFDSLLLECQCCYVLPATLSTARHTQRSCKMYVACVILNKTVMKNLRFVLQCLQSFTEIPGSECSAFSHFNRTVSSVTIFHMMTVIVIHWLTTCVSGAFKLKLLWKMRVHNKFGRVPLHFCSARW